MKDNRTYVVWIRHSSYKEDEHINVTAGHPRDYRNSHGEVTYEVLLKTEDWEQARTRTELERAYQENEQRRRHGTDR